MFQIRDEQVAALRRKKIGEATIALVAPFADAAWDGTGHFIQLSDASGHRGTLGFDTLGFVASYTSPLGRSWQLGNDPDGRALHMRSPSGHTVWMDYNEEGLLASLASSTQSRTDLFYERRLWTRSRYADDTWDSLEYTPSGEISRMTGRLGHHIAFSRDEHHRLTGLADGNGNATRLVYGSLTLPEAVIYPNGTTERFRYNAEGKLSAILQDEDSILVEVNVAGRPLKLVYPDGTELSYVWDDGGRLLEAALKDENGEQASAFTYNDAGQPVEEIIGDLTHTWTYDAGMRLSAVATLIPGADPRGSTFAWDADHRLTGYVAWGGGKHRIEHLAEDRGFVTIGPHAADPDSYGVQTLTKLEVAGRLEGLSVSIAGAGVFSLRCAYDSESRLSASSDSIFGDHAFSYDAEGKLLYAGASQAERFESFAYDRAGNLVFRNGQRLAYDAHNQLLQDGNDRLTWDTRGNLVGRSGPGGVWRFRYNSRNLMTASTAPDGAETAYGYDALGRRTLKRGTTHETRFIWAAEQMIAEVRVDRSTGRATRQEYLYHPETNAPLATCLDGTVYSVHCDHLGTPRAVVDHAGRPVWLAGYSAFGHATVVLETVPMPLRMPGQYFDSETGFHYNRFRYYAPEWGRYTTRDPLGLVAGLNLYAYCGGDPVNGSDRYGLINWRTVGALVVGAAVGIAVGVVLAPLLGPAAIVVAGAIAGAVAGGLNQALNEKHFCLACIAKAAGLGALAGAVGALPFLLLPAAAGILAFAAAGAAGGALSYGMNCLDGAEPHPSWSGLATSVGIGGVFGGAGKGIGDAVGGGGAVEGHTTVGESSTGTGAKPTYPVQTKPNEAFFWSGRSPNPDGTYSGGPLNAQEIASKQGGTTLENLIEQKGIAMPKFDKDDAASIDAWKQISSDYANGASGDVKAVVGSSLRPGNIWEASELPALQANPDVTSITIIDPATGESSVLWTR